MTNPLVSIIVPCYRQGHFLTQTVDSALSQSLSEIEVIVVNDGSDDNTDEVARGYGDRIIFVTQDNQGLSAARNTAINVASGKYLHCLDSDDVLHPEAIATMVGAMEGREDRIVVVGIQDFEHSITDTHLNNKVHQPGLEPFPLLIHGNFGPPVGILSSRKKVKELGGFDTSLRSCEDWKMWLELILAGAHVVAVPQILTFYRCHAGSMSKNRLRMLEARTNVLMFLHKEMLARPELLEMFGQELLLAEYRVRRRWLAAHKTSHLVSHLSELIHVLEQKNINLPRSSLRLFADRCLGLVGEKLAMKYFRLLRPEVYNSYANGCN